MAANRTLIGKNRGKLNNEYLLMGWSEYLLNFQFSPIFFLTVYSMARMVKYDYRIGIFSLEV